MGEVITIETQLGHFPGEGPCEEAESAEWFTMQPKSPPFPEPRFSHLRNGSLCPSWYILNSQGAVEPL